MYPEADWVHIYTDGILLKDSDSTGAGVHCHVFSFNLTPGKFTTTFDVDPWTLRCNGSWVCGPPSKEGSFNSTDNKESCPFHQCQAYHLEKKLNDLSSRQYSEQNFNKIWWNNCKIFPCGQDVVSEFRLTTGHDCLLKHLYGIDVAQDSFCTLCDFREDVDADPIRRCPALKAFPLCDLYWQTKGLLGS
ncbi:hypothetical protein TNCV_186191 [Trichonephila clavipes]|nr:hypothetical protein TNCV_186191 [Trichonephila clavipes]